MIDDAEPAAVHAAGRPPTYTSWLRGRSDDDLAALFAARPDLMTPVPADIAALAARATSRPAVLRVLDQLDRFALQVLEGLLALGDDRLGSGVPGVGRARLAAALPAPAPLLDAALHRLRVLGVVWEDGERLRPVAVLRDILPQPAGLGPPLRALVAGRPAEWLNRLAAGLGLPTGYDGGAPADRVAAELSRPDRLGRLLAEAGDDARQVLDRLVWGPPRGTVSQAGRDVDAASAASPIDRLLARGLLVATDDHTVTLPREVGLHLRGGRLFRRIDAKPPSPTGPRHPPERVTQAAAGQAFTVIRAVAELLELWADDPPGVLRNGGLGVRDLRRSARVLDGDEAGTAVLVEAAHAAGLIAASAEVDGEWLPTPAFDLWLAAEPAWRWLRLAEAWLASTRVARLGGTKDARGRPRNVLGEGLDRRSAPEVRLDVLRTLAAAPEGTAPTTESVAERLAWARPRRQGPAFTDLVQAALAEAALLGLTGLGALAPHARALVAEVDGRTRGPSGNGGPAGHAAEPSGSAAVAALAPELPQPVDRVLIQGDLTAVAPGPLVPELARELALAADVESTGGATVYRFTDSSIRRALDAGRGGAELLDLLDRCSSTPLPQPLRYLVADVARRHGRLRVGTASSYLRCDEPAVLDELVNDRRAADLMLVRLAPTVVASRATRPVLLERLTDLGYHPVAEAVDGSLQLNRPESRRSARQPVGGELAEPAAPGPELRAAAVRAVRAGDEAATSARRPVTAPSADPPRSPTAATLAALGAAVSEGRRVWIGYLDAEGRASSRIVEPARVDGGYLTAYDATQAAVRRFAVHRITGVAEIGTAEPAS
ncbi:helicase-associated domain-containing protein [Marinitenerispora sediminis]|uniref:Helicase n=1 Tax=Marinitenerispora sediminis TaxID=1931232 RepID=A0A368T6J7_9ACTN|nr:helicase-associated domain-containing protein [Marinitenerispora sediminis]RCV54875.1 helicase [Marinitenerispora sediminis]RCV59262.1 helicase [Marinitenerispora sediminis]RCV60276.1 helicase [Marinitenerispora sediminis]